MLRIFVVMMLWVGAALAQLPDAPSATPHTWEQVHGKSAGIVTFRTKWTDPAMRSNKQLLKSPVFWLVEAGMFTSYAVACHNPNSGEECSSELAAVSGVTGLNYVAMRFFGELHVALIGAYVTTHYARSASK